VGASLDSPISASAASLLHCVAMRRALWVGDTDKLHRASDSTFAQLVGTSADYAHFKRVSGAAAIQSAIAELRAHTSEP
jgi:hypothetical protein